MTGFGQASAESEHHRVSITLRGVNHRYLDVSLRLRDELRDLERPLRDAITDRVERGRVEVVVDVEPTGAPRPSVEIDLPLLRVLNDTLSPLSALGQVDARLHFADLLRIPELVRFSTVEEHALDPAVALEVTGRALEQLVESKAREGASLRAALDERLDALEALRAAMATRAEALPEIQRVALGERLDALLDGVDLDPSRVAQEAAVLADRSDVREELDRLASHLDHFRELLDASGRLGKRLDFLAQEIFRELNTIGSKCRDAELTRRVLDGKVLCEQLREQVQNVE